MCNPRTFHDLLELSIFSAFFSFQSSIIRFRAGRFVAKKAINISENLDLTSANLKEKQQL